MVTILNSWKEIAVYLGRGVRTAQRWERDLALPVRRPRGKDRSAVFAVPTEIDAWLRRCPARSLVEVKAPALNGIAPGRWQIMHQNAEKLSRGTEMLQIRTLRLQEQVERAILLGKRLTNTQASGKSAYRMSSAS